MSTAEIVNILQLKLQCLDGASTSSNAIQAVPGTSTASNQISKLSRSNSSLSSVAAQTTRSAASSNVIISTVSTVDKEDALETLDAVYRLLSNRIIPANERKQLKSAIIDYLIAFGLRGDVTIENRFVERFSFSFLPSLPVDCDDGDHSVDGNELDEGNESLNNSLSDQSSLNSKNSFMSLSLVNQIIPPACYCFCVVTRRQTTLKSTFEMSLEDIRLFSKSASNMDRSVLFDTVSPSSSSWNLGSLNVSALTAIANSFPSRPEAGTGQGCSVFLLGSKIRTGRSVSYVYNSAEKALWKSSEALAVINRKAAIYSLQGCQSGSTAHKNSSSQVSPEVSTVSSDAKIASPPSPVSSAAVTGNILVNSKFASSDKLIPALLSAHKSNPAELLPLLSVKNLPKALAGLQQEGVSLLSMNKAKEVSSLSNDIRCCRSYIPSKKNCSFVEFDPSKPASSVGSQTIFQLGKISADSYAVDFTNMTPLQVSTQCLISLSVCELPDIAVVCDDCPRSSVVTADCSVTAAVMENNY